MAADKVTSAKGQAWFCTTGLPSDVVVDVDDMTFHLHKFPLMAKSRKLHELITEQETYPTSTAVPRKSGGEIEETKEEKEYHHITFRDFPGGSETFEIAAKFCYAVKIKLSPSNVAPLRCAGEVLEMTEEYSEDNLISKAERFLSQTVLKSVVDSIKALKSCENLMPMAESLGIVQRCIDSIAAKASMIDPCLFGWPVNEPTSSAAVSSHQTGSSVRSKGYTARVTSGPDWYWIDELTHVSLPLFKRLIIAMKEHDLNPEIIQNCLIFYAKEHIAGINRTGRKSSSSSVLSAIEQKELLETIITTLPENNCSRPSTAVTSFFGMLRAVNILHASDGCKTILEKKIGSQLEQATLDDLLMPSYSYLSETLYDVDFVQRILARFLHGVADRTANEIDDENAESEDNGVRLGALVLVGKLVDDYLAEIALDANLKPEKFCELAISLPEQARLNDDALYRSVDVYLKAHPWITGADREKVCGVMDCRKLTLEACSHAAQNERLPLKAVVQVLFFEQLQLRQAIAGTLMATVMSPPDTERQLGTRQKVPEEDDALGEGDGGADVARGTWRAAVRENQVLRVDMDSMRARVQDLERECSTMKSVIEKIDKAGPIGPGGWRGSFTKKFGCTFKTQVCDSQEPTLVQSPRVSTHQNRQRPSR